MQGDRVPASKLGQCQGDSATSAQQLCKRCAAEWEASVMCHAVPRQFLCGHFVYDTSSTDISSTTVYQRVGQLYIQLLFQQIIIFINSNFYLHYDSFLAIPLPLTL